MRPFLVRLDQTARTLNIWLAAVAIGLGVLDFTVLVGKSVEALVVEASMTPPSFARSEVAQRHPAGKRAAIDLAQWPGGASGLR